MTKPMKRLMTALAGISLISCTHAPVPDDPLYTVKGKLGARVSYMRKESQHKNHNLTLEQWRKIEYGKVCMAPETIIGMKGALKILCNTNKATCYWFKSEVKEVEDLLERAAREK